ncbi:hypothetical protein AB5N19_00580 [Seiridium cardinale]
MHVMTSWFGYQLAEGQARPTTEILRVFIIAFLLSVLAFCSLALLLYGWFHDRKRRIKGDIYLVPSLKQLFDIETHHITTETAKVPKDQSRLVNQIRLHNSWYYGKHLNGYWQPLTGRTIRLLRIHPGEFHDLVSCSLSIKSLNSKTSIIAVSYAWGGLQNSRAITINGIHGFIVSENAYHVLRRMRALGEYRYVWLDAICINQSLSIERGHQVELMDRIYSFAQLVYIYLGPCRSSMNENWDKEIQECTRHDYELIRSPSTLFAKTWLHDIFPKQSQWWYRVWTVQEAVLAREIRVLIGPHYLEWNDLTYLARSEQLPNFAKQSIAELGDLRYAWNVQERRRGLMLSELLQRSARRRATEPLDKIYGLLAMAANPIIADYSLSHTGADRKVTRHIIETEVSQDIYLQGNWPRQKSTSSWSLQFHKPHSTWISALDLCMEFSGIKPSATSGGDLKVKFQDHEMICRGLKFDEIIMKIDFSVASHPRIEVGGGFQLDFPGNHVIYLKQFYEKESRGEARIEFLTRELQQLTNQIVSESARGHEESRACFETRMQETGIVRRDSNSKGPKTAS